MLKQISYYFCSKVEIFRSKFKKNDFKKIFSIDPKNPVIRANQVIKMKDTPEPAGVEPTFREFIDYVINADLGRYHSDDHWIPYHQYCTPCSLNYDFINKVLDFFS